MAGMAQGLMPSVSLCCLERVCFPFQIFLKVAEDTGVDAEGDAEGCLVADTQTRIL